MPDTLIDNKDWMNRLRSFFMSPTKWSYFTLFALGALNSLAYAPFGFWPYIFVSIAGLIFAIDSSTNPKQGFKYGFSYGLGWFAIGISWVHVAIADFGGLPLPVSLLLMALLAAYLALFPAFACWLTLRFKSKLGIIGLLPFWMLAEWLRSVFLTGFPWLSLGYTQTQSPLGALAPIIGEVGLQAIVFGLGISLATLLTLAGRRQVSAARYFQPLGLVLGVFLIAALASQLNWVDQSDKQVNISLVQGNIPQSIKWQPDNEMPTMEKYLRLSQTEFDRADVIIWPEAAIPRLEIISNEFLREVDRLAAATNTAVVTGIVDYQPDTTMAFNNLIVLGKKQPEDEFGHYKYLHNNRYSKHHLLPIGETVPFESVLRKLAPLFDLPMSSFSYGSYQQDNLVANGLHLSPAICFEIAFSDQVRANLYRQKENYSDFILTVSNDAWFGNSHGPWQHLQIAQMRALEFAMPVIRVTNNGVTAFIGSKGEVLAALPQFEEGVARLELPLSKSLTPYYRYGNWPMALLILAYCGASFTRRHKVKASQKYKTRASNQ